MCDQNIAGLLLIKNLMFLFF